MAARFLITGGGSVTWDASNTAIWSATSGGGTGASVPGSGDTVTMDGSSGGGTVTLGYSPTVTSITMGAYTGTFNASTFSPTMATFSGSGTGTRTLNMGSGTWTLTGNNATIWNVGTITNLTMIRSANPILCTYSGSTGTRTVVHTDTGETTCPAISITAGTDTVTFNATRVFNLDFTGFAGILGTGTFVTYGNLTLATGMTTTATVNAISFAATSGTKVLTSSGVTIDRPITLISPGATIQLADNLTMGVTRTLGISNGIFDANNKNLSIGLFSSSNANLRSILMGSGTWTITGVGTVFSTSTTTNLTLNAGTSTISVTDTSASGKTIAFGAGMIYNNFSITGGGAGIITFNNTSTINNLTIGGPKTVTFLINLTLTILGTVNVVGTSGNVITLNSSVAGTRFIWSKSSGTVSADYLSIQDSTAQGGASWYAGANSTNVSGNRGWQFSKQDVSKANFFQVM